MGMDHPEIMLVILPWHSSLPMVLNDILVCFSPFQARQAHVMSLPGTKVKMTRPSIQHTGTD